MIHTTIHQSIKDPNYMQLKENNQGNKLALEKKKRRGRVHTNQHKEAKSN